jgi:hypothetical protein
MEKIIHCRDIHSKDALAATTPVRIPVPQPSWQDDGNPQYLQVDSFYDS